MTGSPTPQERSEPPQQRPPGSGGGLTSRRTLLRAGAATAVGAAAIGGVELVGSRGSSDGDDGSGDGEDGQGGARRTEGAVTARKVRDLTGPEETGEFGADWTDLGIPVIAPADGTMLYLCGDTYDGRKALAGDWRSPVALRCSSTDLDRQAVDGCVGGDHAKGLVPEDHKNDNTALPSDVFAIGDTLYTHLMRGPLHQTHRTDFWRSQDNGESWERLCEWPGDRHDGQFQQKTYAVADDGYCYVLSTVFKRDVTSGLLLHRVRHEDVGDPDAYEPWGDDGDGWGWGKAPTSVTTRRRWGEICLRAMGGRYAFTWLHHNKGELSLRAQVFDSPTANLFETPERTMILPTEPGAEKGNRVASPYGGFIFPGSTLDDFHIAVSQWHDERNYRVMQYRVEGLEG